LVTEAPERTVQLCFKEAFIEVDVTSERNVFQLISFGFREKPSSGARRRTSRLKADAEPTQGRRSCSVSQTAG
jgi:hypothetical protein